MSVKESKDNGPIWIVILMIFGVIAMFWGLNRACSGAHSKDSPADQAAISNNKP
ncbi:MAG: hypothetical protein WCP24_02810 [bacterium]